jgi:multiple sugar transport system substrate-binding protein
MQSQWATAPLPRPASSEHSVSQAGGCGLVIFRRAKQPKEAWRLIEFLSQPAQQVRFYELTGNLPPRKAAWELGRLRTDPKVEAFYKQLQFAAPLPRVPEWEQITTKIMHAGQSVIAGQTTISDALAVLNRQVDSLLEKHRWMLARHERAR